MAMTVKDLMYMLVKFPPDTLVILSADEEGNSFSPLADTNAMIYNPRWREAIDLELAEIGEEDVTTVCLWPTH